MLSTPIERQRAIVAYYSKSLAQNGVKVLKKSPPQLRVGLQGDPEKVLSAINPCTITPSADVMSGSYSTYELTINKQIPGAHAGDTCYFVPTTRAGATTTHGLLTPEKLGLAGRKVPVHVFKSEVEKGIKNVKTDDNIKMFLFDIMEASSSPTGMLDPKILDTIDKKDLATIINSFGEISGAWWLVKTKDRRADHIMYPASLQEKLVDYYIYVGGHRKAVSAKAKKSGAVPSISSIGPALKKLPRYSDAGMEKARQLLLGMIEGSVADSTIKTAKDFKASGYTWLKDNYFGKDFTLKDINEMLARYSTSEQLLNDLTPWYKTLSRGIPKQDTINQIFIQNRQRYGLILSPLAYDLVVELNKDKDALAVLNEAATSINVRQVYMSIMKSTRRVQYTVSGFTTGEFIFVFHGNAKTASAHRIGQMLKKGAH